MIIVEESMAISVSTNQSYKSIVTYLKQIIRFLVKEISKKDMKL
jgi:hypothetical protein